MRTLSKSIRFHKYSALDNILCLVDELSGTILSEEDKLTFSHYANSIFGIGCDSILFVQAPGPAIFAELEKRFADLWNKSKTYDMACQILSENAEKADAIMRVFEPTAQESAMCGNGIRCVADYLFRKQKLRKVKIITELTTPLPRVREVEKGVKPHSERLEMKEVNPIPLQFKGKYYDHFLLSSNDNIDIIDLPLPFAMPGIGSYQLRGYLIYTGEPHLVFFTAPDQQVQGLLGLPPNQLSDFFSLTEKQRIEIVRVLGDYMNDRWHEDYALGMINKAEGINIDIAEVQLNNPTINMRVYERGIWDKTKSCGTGAAAVAILAHSLKVVKSNFLTVLCEGSFFDNGGDVHNPGCGCQVGEIMVTVEGPRWFVEGPVEHIFSGTIKNWRKKLVFRRRDIGESDSYNKDALGNRGLYNQRNKRQSVI